MKLRTKEERVRLLFWGIVIIFLAVTISCIGICAGDAIVIPVEADKQTEPPTAETVYTDAPEIRHLPFYSLTLDERDLFAALVAGKAVGEPAGCQQAVATVLLNTIRACDGDVSKARKAYTWDDVQTPTDDTYDAVDAVFVRGERLLDDDVLWIARAGEPDAFHKGLEEVCTIGGVTFYREKA